MSKEIIVLILAVITLIIGYTGLYFLSNPAFITGSSEYPQIDPSKPRILLVCLTGGMGGGENHTISLFNLLKKNQYFVMPLVQANSILEHYFTSQKISFYTTKANKFHHILRPFFHFILKRCLYTISKQNNIDIIHCNTRPEIPGAVAAKHRLPIRIIFTHHCVKPLSANQIKELDAICAGNKATLLAMQRENEKMNLGIKIMDYIPPLFNAEKFITFSATETQNSSRPIIAMIGNFYQQLWHKNHSLLFQAIKKLVNEKNKPVDVMLAGDGPRKRYLENLAKELGIDQYIHFLGFTDKTPELLHNADMLVLTSIKESFGIVYLEAGLMKKPAIGATETGAESIIVAEKTGLLFKNNDAQDLANQIERLIDSPEWSRELGHNAYVHVMNNFSPAVTFAKYEKVYQALQVPGQQ